MTEFLPVISSQPSDRRQYSQAFKRQIVEESFVSGTSISGVAHSYGINANLLHKWRCRYRRGEYGVAADPSTLLPVQMCIRDRDIINPSHWRPVFVGFERAHWEYRLFT